MAIIVSTLGAVVVLVGLAGLVRPQILRGLIEGWKGPTRFWGAVLLRVVLGAVLIVVAPACRLPTVVLIIGIVTIAAAVGILILGRTKLDAFIRWWLMRPDLIRVAAVFALLFGALLIYAGA